jgi:4-aminobutyrate aminotransferase-like enzyme
VGDVRGKGLLLGIELVEDKQTKKPAAITMVNKVISVCKDKGLIIGKNGDTVAGYNNILQLSPPLCITEDDFTFIVKTLKESILEL